MVHFNNCLTTGDLMHRFYGRHARTFASIVGICFSVIILSSQIRAIEHLSNHLLNLPSKQVTLIIGILIVLYTDFRRYAQCGLYRCATVYSDDCSILALKHNPFVPKVGGLKTLLKRLPAEKLSIFNHPHLWLNIEAGIFFGLIPTYLFSPPIVLRMLTVQNKQQVRQMFLAGAALLLCLTSILCINRTRFNSPFQ